VTRAAVVGAGHNGLVAAAMLARAGLDVTVLEARRHVGGACVTERPFASAPALGASTGAYLLGLMPPEVMEDLGLDLPLVTLVGVISADTGLHVPDYRSAERTFQVLSQVAGRAGRSLLGGQVILQTFHPEHHAIRAAAAHDYAGFYRAELEQRRELGYPPYSRLVRLVGLRPGDTLAEREGIALVKRMRAAASEAGVDISGPVPCFYSRRRGLARWQILLRGPNPAAVAPIDLPDGWSIDVDPVSLL